MNIAFSIIVLSSVIALGKILGKYKLFGVSLGVAWILFVGIAFSHFGYGLDSEILHFIKEFGLILFVFSIGMQVGPSFFSIFGSGGVKLNLLATILVVSGVVVTTVLIKFTGADTITMVGVMSGAVTNTPGLGAAQQTYVDTISGNPSMISQGYAVAYPLGVVGCILSFILLKKIFKIENKVEASSNNGITGTQKSGKYIQCEIRVNRRKIEGVVLEQLKSDRFSSITVKTIRRAEIVIAAKPDSVLQKGDILTVVGAEDEVAQLGIVLGKLIKRREEPNLVAIFAGIAIGCAIGIIPIHLPGIPQPIKLGLAGGPLIVSILISYFGSRLGIATYMTSSANITIREIGISLFLSCVGLEAGCGFVDTIVNKGGLMWIAYGAIITIVPVLVCGVIGKIAFKIKFSTLIGVLAGASTNPPALSFAGELCNNNDEVAAGYATVYPLTMFLRVLAAQIMVLFAVL